MHVQATMDLELKMLVEGVVSGQGFDAACYDPGIEDVTITVLDRSKGRPYTTKQVSIFEGVPQSAIDMIKMNILEAMREEISTEIEHHYKETAA